MIDNKIIFTTPAVYSQRLTEAFNDAGFRNISSSPAIVNRLIVDDTVYKPLFDDLLLFDYVILPSRNAVNSFVNAARRLKIPDEHLKNSRYIAIGNDNLYLESLGLNTVALAKEPSTEGIVNALKNENGVKRMAVLVPKVEVIPEPDIIPEFIKGLKSIGKLTVIEAYITSPSYGFDPILLSDIKTGKYDLVAFTSGGEIEALKYLINDNTVFENIRAACFGPYTASTAKRAGLEPVMTGEEFDSFAGFAGALKRYFASRE